MEKQSTKNSDKKICILVDSLRPGGAERIAQILAQELNLHFDVSLVAIKEIDDAVIQPDLQPQYLLPKTEQQGLLQIPKAVSRFHQFCKTNEIDIVFSLLTKSHLISSLSKRFGSTYKLILSHHTILSAWRKDNKIYRLGLRMATKLSSIAGQHHVISERIGNDLVDAYNMNADEITCISNPHPIHSIITLSQESIDSNIDFSLFTFISAGSLKQVKNQELLLRSYAKIAHSKNQLLLLGSGPDEAHLKLIVDELGIQENVHFLGFHQNPFAYFRLSDVFVLSSINEGLPNVIIEAMACNCAIISTDCVSGPREILGPTIKTHNGFEETEIGLLTMVNDAVGLSSAMHQLESNCELLLRLKTKAKQSIQQYNLSHIMPQYLALFHRV